MHRDLKVCSLCIICLRASFEWLISLPEQQKYKNLVILQTNPRRSIFMFKDNFRTGSFCVKLESSKKNLVCMTVRAIGDGGPGALDKKWLKKPNLSYGKLLFFSIFVVQLYVYSTRCHQKQDFSFLAVQNKKKLEEFLVSSRGGKAFKNSKREGGKSELCE